MSTENVIIDNGSGYTKAGLSGEDAPRSVFPCIVGRPKVDSIMVGSEKKNFTLEMMPKPKEVFWF